MTTVNFISGIVHNRCPRCRKGPFWVHANPYINLFRNGGAMFDRCSACGLKYEKDVGFWYGAMMVSYGLNVGLFLTLWFLYSRLLPEKAGIGYLIVSIIATSLIFFPVIFHLARLIWIRLFVRFDPTVKADKGTYTSVQTKR